jgi:hypothetical protein
VSTSGALSAAELLAAWEAGLDQPPAYRALPVLAAACGISMAAAAQVSLGRRDGRLLDIRERAFGPSMACMTACPRCGETVEFTCDSRTIRLEVDDDKALEETVCVDRWSVRVRAPDSTDLAAIAGENDVDAAAQRLFALCVIAAERDGVPAQAGDLPPDVRSMIDARLVALDPQADVRFRLACPGCSTPWEAMLDVAALLWIEVDAWSRRMLREVHTLASTYGWAEVDILRMSPRRRQAYLELAGP